MHSTFTASHQGREHSFTTHFGLFSSALDFLSYSFLTPPSNFSLNFYSQAQTYLVSDSCMFIPGCVTLQLLHLDGALVKVAEPALR